MSHHHECQRLLRIIADHADHAGRAPVQTVEQAYGHGFADAWTYASNRFYLGSGGGTHALELSELGRLILD